MNEMGHVILTLDRKDISYVRFILEGYDGLGVISTIDAYLAKVRIAFPLSQTDDIESLVNALSKEISITNINWTKNHACCSEREEK